MDFRATVFTGVFLILMAEQKISYGSTTGVHHEYHFIETPMTWADAQSFCRMNYNDLATITNMEEHALAKGMVGNADFAWIGLETSGTTEWLWSDGIGIMTIFQWRPGPQRCGSMRFNGNWETRECSERLHSLCYYYDSDMNEKYFFNSELLSWREALSYCRQHFIDLVSVESKEQNELIHLVANKKTFWMGLFRDDWMWSDGSPSSFRVWFTDMPKNDGGDQNCGVLRRDKNLQWGDKPCNDIFPFVCHGQRRVKKIAVKVQVSSGVDPNLPSVSDALLKQFQAQLEETGVSNFKISWRVQKNGQIFRCEEEQNKKTKK